MQIGWGAILQIHHCHCSVNIYLCPCFVFILIVHHLCFPLAWFSLFFYACNKDNHNENGDNDYFDDNAIIIISSSSVNISHVH